PLNFSVMKNLLYTIIGGLLGRVLYKSEASSWYPIYEMLRFDAVNMYGIIGAPLGLGIMLVQAITSSLTNSIFGDTIILSTHKMSFSRYLLGGILFGLEWALAGACPGPIYILIGAGHGSMLVVLLGALLGAFAYGAF